MLATGSKKRNAHLQTINLWYNRRTNLSAAN
ncbi:unnamed protein product, partial [Allacma fusca]